MTQEETTKVCKACAQVINAPAKICPYCRSVQGCWAFLSWQNPVVTALVVLIVTAAALSVPLVLRESLFEGEDFSNYRGAINVVESSFHLQDGKNGLELSVVGILTNTSSLAWKNIQVEAQLLDADGKLIDSVTDRHFDQAVLPHDVMSFRLLSKAARERAEYATHKLSVRFAKDGRNHW